ncbi:peptide-methionine (S)-S-oxide reductase MsrA [Desulfocurvus sp. DL9XJH121]
MTTDTAPPESGGSSPRQARAIFAGGCFWCMQGPFEARPGVLRVVAGYTGGRTDNPTYEDVCSGDTGHAEAVLVEYDPGRATYAELLDVFWKNVDPTDAGGQFCDRGGQYRTAIFPVDRDQEAQARRSLAEIEASGRLPGPIATRIEPAGPFWPAEDHHQDFHRRNPVRYRAYRSASGRDLALNRLWGPKD